MAYSVPNTNILNQQIISDLNTTGSTTALDQVGVIIDTQDGRSFQYVLNDSSGVANVAGAPVAWQATTTRNVITPDLSDSSASGFAGVATAIIADVSYGWIQVGGFVPDAAVSTGVAAKVC